MVYKPDAAIQDNGDDCNELLNDINDIIDGSNGAYLFDNIFESDDNGFPFQAEPMYDFSQAPLFQQQSFDYPSVLPYQVQPSTSMQHQPSETGLNIDAPGELSSKKIIQERIMKRSARLKRDSSSKSSDNLATGASISAEVSFDSKSKNISKNAEQARRNRERKKQQEAQEKNRIIVLENEEKQLKQDNNQLKSEIMAGGVYQWQLKEMIRCDPDLSRIIDFVSLDVSHLAPGSSMTDVQIAHSVLPTSGGVCLSVEQLGAEGGASSGLSAQLCVTCAKRYSALVSTADQSNAFSANSSVIPQFEEQLIPNSQMASVNQMGFLPESTFEYLRAGPSLNLLQTSDVNQNIGFLSQLNGVDVKQESNDDILFTSDETTSKAHSDIYVIDELTTP